MSLQVVYSFDHIITSDLVALPKVIAVTQCTIGGSSGRDGTGAMIATAGASDGMVVALDSPNSKVTIGAWVMIETVGNGFLNVANPAGSDSNNPFGTHCCLKAQSDGSIAIWRKIPELGTFLGQSAGGVFNIGVPFYLEFQATIGTTGSCIIRVNEVEVLHLNTVNNQVGTDGNVQSVVFSGGQGKVRFDDVYILTSEDTSDGWTDFKGIIKVNAKLVNGAGDLTQWAPSSPTGVNWQNVDENTPSVVDFNDAASVGLVDTYNIEDVAFDPIAVQVDLYMQKLAAGASSIAHVARIGGVNHPSAEISALGTTFKYYKKVWTTVPGGSAWTIAIFNALQVGPQRTV